MIKEATFLAYQAQAKGLIADQAKIIADQKQMIEELGDALRVAISAIEEIKKGMDN